MNVRWSVLRRRRRPAEAPDATPQVPFIAQRLPDGCGAACLAMVLAAHGRPVDSAELHRATMVRAAGTDAWTLLATARRFGLAGRGVRITDLDALAALPTPAILHLRGDHFVVLAGWAGGRASILDPALGRGRWGRRQLRRLFSGTALELTPAPSSDRDVSICDPAPQNASYDESDIS